MDISKYIMLINVYLENNHIVVHYSNLNISITSDENVYFTCKMVTFYCLLY